MSGSAVVTDLNVEPVCISCFLPLEPVEESGLRSQQSRVYTVGRFAIYDMSVNVLLFNFLPSVLSVWLFKKRIVQDIFYRIFSFIVNDDLILFVLLSVTY